MSTIALVTDLIFATRIRTTAEDLGVLLRCVRTVEGLTAALTEHSVERVIVDLNADRVDVCAAIRVARAAPSVKRVVAYVSHVQADLAESARQAGATRVLARSAFVAELPALLANK